MDKKTNDWIEMDNHGTCESPSLGFASRKTLQVAYRGDEQSITFRKFKLVIEQGPDIGREFIIDRERTRVGSAPDNDLIIEHETISRYHLEIIATEAGHRIRDLDSTNGVQLDGTWIMDALLHPRARMRLGDVVLVYQPLKEKVEVPLSSNTSFGAMLGHSVRMRALFRLVERVVSNDSTLLITGETGVGKGLLAEQIHRFSHRSKKPFQVVDCSTIPPNLMESELFGHVKGAFTGALSTQPGAFQQANGGTVFLDEIGELMPPMQTKLLRVIESKQVRPVGSPDDVKVDVRIIAATNRKLKAEVAAKHFREDLYFRLNVIELNIPPLRERKDDIPHLARTFLDELCGDERHLDEGAMRLLLNHTWPGNVRELRNVIERVARLADDKIIQRASLLATAAIQINNVPKSTQACLDGDIPISAAKELFEKQYLVELLKRHDSNVTEAAQAAGIHRQSLHRLLRKHGLRSNNKPRFAAQAPALHGMGI